MASHEYSYRLERAFGDLYYLYSLCSALRACETLKGVAALGNRYFLKPQSTGKRVFGAAPRGFEKLLPPSKAQQSGRLKSCRLKSGRLICGRLICGRLTCGRLKCGRLICGRLIYGRLICGRLKCGRLKCGRLKWGRGGRRRGLLWLKPRHLH